MPRPSWKGNSILSLGVLLKSKEFYLCNSKDILPDKLTIHRRNITIPFSAANSLKNITLMLYNGYNFYSKDLANSINFGHNLGACIITREMNVTHKAKLSKHAKKNLQLKSNKKKMLTGSVKKNKKIKK